MATGRFVATAENMLMLGPPGGAARPISPSPSNQMVTQWGHVFGDEVIAAAVLDRLLHHSRAMVVQGDSFRLRQEERVGLLGSSKT